VENQQQTTQHFMVKPRKCPVGIKEIWNSKNFQSIKEKRLIDEDEMEQEVHSLIYDPYSIFCDSEMLEECDESEMTPELYEFEQLLQTHILGKKGKKEKNTDSDDYDYDDDDFYKKLKRNESISIDSDDNDDNEIFGDECDLTPEELEVLNIKNTMNKRKQLKKCDQRQKKRKKQEQKVKREKQEQQPLANKKSKKNL
jgi:hypothetical protein